MDGRITDGRIADGRTATSRVVAHGLQLGSSCPSRGAVMLRTIDSLASPLKTSDGGTGLNTFTDKGVFYASNTSTMAQVTGSSGQVLQITSGEPNFDDLDGGSY